MKHLLIIFSILLLTSPLFGQSEETCYVDADSSKEFDPILLSNISVSLISEFLKEVEHLPPAGIPMDACVYQIDAVKVKDTTFVTFKGKNLNSYGDSKLSGPDGFQESVLKALYRALEDKRKLICDAYGEFIVECGGVVKKIPAEKIETIREMKNKYDQLKKRIAVLDTRIERLNSGAVKVVTNPDSFENPKLDGVKKVFTDEPVVQKTGKDKTKGLFVSVGDLHDIITSSDGKLWTKRRTSGAEKRYGVTYGNGLFVTVGRSGYISTSSDGTGTSWTYRISGNEYLYGVTYGNGLFVTVGGSGTILTSPDGTSWTQRRYFELVQRKTGIANHLWEVTYGNGLFVTVGKQGTILTSSDGTSWTKRNSGTLRFLRGVTYGNGLFITVGKQGTILTSPDGTTWTLRTSGIPNLPDGTSPELYGVTYGNGLFVTVGFFGTILTSSDNGTTWTTRTSGIEGDYVEYLNDVTYGNTTFVAVSSTGTILTSGDGTSWTQRTSADHQGDLGYLHGVTYSQ
jgi:hypothetical protein